MILGHPLLIARPRSTDADKVWETHVTVHQPCPRIIRDKRQYQIPIRRQHSNVSSWRIEVVECLVREDPGACSKDIEVVAVQMDGMCDGRSDGGNGLNDPE